LSQINSSIINSGIASVSDILGIEGRAGGANIVAVQVAALAREVDGRIARENAGGLPGFHSIGKSIATGFSSVPEGADQAVSAVRESRASFASGLSNADAVNAGHTIVAGDFVTHVTINSALVWGRNLRAVHAHFVDAVEFLQVFFQTGLDGKAVIVNLTLTTRGIGGLTETNILVAVITLAAANLSVLLQPQVIRASLVAASASGGHGEASVGLEGHFLADGSSASSLQRFDMLSKRVVAREWVGCRRGANGESR